MKQPPPLHTIVHTTRTFLLCCIILLTCNHSFASSHDEIRTSISLNNDWRRTSGKNSNISYTNAEKKNYNDKSWHRINVPDNVNTYEGVQRLKHNDFHGDAWYRKKFRCTVEKGKRYFLFFEGVGAYATVWVNEKMVGQHAGGRTSFTLDITDFVENSTENLLVVKASHPEFIKELPWVCGGCSDETGFSEGSQPTGIFRPVTLMITNEINITPFGVHIWNDSTATEKQASLFINTEIKNCSKEQQTVKVQHVLKDAENKTVFTVDQSVNIPADSTILIHQMMRNVQHVMLWNLEHPYLYKLVTTIKQGNNIIDAISNAFGIRTISWPNAQHKQFLLNGKPVFINGTAEYEHLLGKSHAFSKEEIEARISQVKSAGFNSFRDAHQPHNFLYGKLTNENGLLWWPQFAAHIWFDTPAFKNNFINLLKDWVKERRNDPSVILWGLENESTLPEDFAKKCTDIILSLDPTASSQRMITTCNGGSGTDWNVPQNWSGTYGGDTAKYAEELKKEILVGEYGAWRSIGAHAEADTAKGIKLTENYMCGVLESKIRLAESVKNEVAGHYNWLLYSHENPGRLQSGESIRDISRIGPANYKGLFTLWGEPTDAFYMYRANYVDASKAPMVYIVSHTWPDRWIEPGIKNNIIVYSNCDEVELFNDVDAISLGKRKHNGIGTHFEWDNVNIHYNILYAVGYENGKAVAKDTIVLHHLPVAPHFNNLYTDQPDDIIKPAKDLNYIYRINCGGNNYKDNYGNTWLADIPYTCTSKFGSSSWADDYTNVPSVFASQGNNNDPVKGTNAWPLFQSFRYGLNKLKYDFPVDNGDYVVELYFAEPWYGVANVNAKKWRLFDIAINDSIVEKDVDLFANAGYNHAIRRSFKVHVTNGNITISFPNEKAGEAVIMAIAIATENKKATKINAVQGIITNLSSNVPASVQYWMNTGDTVFFNHPYALNELPSALYGAEWIQSTFDSSRSLYTYRFTVTQKGDVYVAGNDASFTTNNNGFSTTGSFIQTANPSLNKLVIYRKRYQKNETVIIRSLQPCIIAVNEAVDMASSYDLRSAVAYSLNKAVVNGYDFTLDSMYNKYAIHFKNESGDTVIWSVPVGAAGMFGIKIRYRTNDETAREINMVITDAEGRMIKNEMLHLPAYTKAKWGTQETNTGSYINAGKYNFTFYTIKAKGLSISSIEVQ